MISIVKMVSTFVNFAIGGILKIEKAKEPIILNATNSPKIEVFSDSQYLVKGMKEWLPNWLRRNWKTAQGKPIENRDLWEVLYKVSKSHKLNFTWIKGHSGHLYNERADYLANFAIMEGIT